MQKGTNLFECPFLHGRLLNNFTPTSFIWPTLAFSAMLHAVAPLLFNNSQFNNSTLLLQIIINRLYLLGSNIFLSICSPYSVARVNKLSFHINALPGVLKEKQLHHQFSPILSIQPYLLVSTKILFKQFTPFDIYLSCHQVCLFDQIFYLGKSLILTSGRKSCLH